MKTQLLKSPLLTCSKAAQGDLSALWVFLLYPSSCHPMKNMPIKINNYLNGPFCLIPGPAQVCRGAPAAHPSQEGPNCAAQTSSKQPIPRATRNPFPSEVQSDLGCPRASKCPSPGTAHGSAPISHPTQSPILDQLSLEPFSIPRASLGQELPFGETIRGAGNVPQGGQCHRRSLREAQKPMSRDKTKVLVTPKPSKPHLRPPSRAELIRAVFSFCRAAGGEGGQRSCLCFVSRCLRGALSVPPAYKAATQKNMSGRFLSGSL